MLTKQLRELEDAGLIVRKVYAQVPPKVEYSLSKKGETLEPVIRALEKWGEEFVIKPAARGSTIRKDHEGHKERN
jgi:DNA-binding HxlR family transcriptional regulator